MRCLLAVALLLASCEAPPPEEIPSLYPDCSDAWGGPPSGGRLVVDGAASAGGDGSEEAPFATFDDALAEARATGLRHIVLANGEYPGHWSLSEDDPAKQDAGLQITGCSRTGTVLVGVEVFDPLEQVDVLAPNFLVSGPSTADIALRDLTLQGGRRALLVQTGAGDDGPILLERVNVDEAVRVGVLIDGPDSVAHLLDVDIDGTLDEGDGFGWGLAVQTRAGAEVTLDEPTVLQGVDITGSVGVGLLAHAAWLDLEGGSVSGTSSVGGELGRGVQLQQSTRADVVALTVSGNADAAIFVHRPGRDGAPVYLSGCALEQTASAGISTAPGEEASDGLVATGGPSPSPLPETLPLVLVDNEFEGNERAHILVEGVAVEVGANGLFGDGTDFAFASQGGAIVTGIGGGPPTIEPEVLDDAGGPGALDLFREAFDLDEP